MPALDRQPVPAAAPGTQDRVPETAPTPLQRQYIYLSTVALIAGAIAITALEIGAPLGSAVVKVCVAVGAPLAIIANADAVLRIWRSAWAWMPTNRGRGLFRLAWVAAAALGLSAIAVAAAIILIA
ncbi:MAG TPA: hypothetical protein VKC59_03380 [Candidatus Limnocylindrales bacterium]|nr:hypothetical protein [Candidatus Limnocylindrales bacterium]